MKNVPTVALMVTSRRRGVVGWAIEITLTPFEPSV